jgi:hypothetical protein
MSQPENMQLDCFPKEYVDAIQAYGEASVDIPPSHRLKLILARS